MDIIWVDSIIQVRLVLVLLHLACSNPSRSEAILVFVRLKIFKLCTRLNHLSVTFLIPVR